MPMFMIFVYKWKAKYLMRPIFDLLLIDNVWFDGSFTSAALSKKKNHYFVTKISWNCTGVIFDAIILQK